jgi:hypothetical protein
MKTTTRRTLTGLVTIALVAGPLTLANADSASNKGQIQRLMVGADKSCQVGQLKVSDPMSNDDKSNASEKSKGKSNGKSNGKNGAEANNSDKSSLLIQAQKLIDQLNAKATAPSIAAALLLQNQKTTYSTNTTAAIKTYSDAVAFALTTCNNTIAVNKGIYDRKVSEAKTALMAAQMSATTEDAKKAAANTSKTAINTAATAFKTGAQTALNKYQSDLTAALNVEKISLGQINSALTAAILVARAALA